MLMKRQDSLLLVIDVQEHLAPVMDSPREVINNCSRLLKAARELGVPFLITEQYPKGLGATMIDLRQAAGEGTEYLPKLEFSCVQNQAILDKIKASGRRQIVICGLECHICVTQTALELKDLGFEVFVVTDATSSRRALETVIAFQRLAAHGVDMVSAEMVVYEWLERAGTPEFKSLSKVK